ncbi:glycerol-3-phosphate dehydrogenase [Phyllobacterium phragmitis]|uniref:Glycerol-3-phosphate dehydrogenase n=1 Tax=Phyllobacterium phragmitis TaxID=2670329 RepID=A0A2S9IWA6_9HYPH|nr:glycerol-3-phosphate dehydrogenase/oxidase [Phyllobacterium phragmitis]PRD44798.1 glycerol-3-phosphate dehydrogenase [Phyllobacterium phragmitis]
MSTQIAQNTDGIAGSVGDGEYDVVIIGAGINGAGLFRELCLQGIKCLIVDKADFGSGTSAAPSRLIHGGIKYLETGELGLVAQSTLERNLLLRNAPHCVAPLPTFIPTFSYVKGALAALRTLAGSTTAPRSRGALLIKIGLSLYDFYGARHRVMPKHRFLFRNAALKEMPAITSRIVAGGIYYDARITRPERLVWELIKDGLEASPGSHACNYAELESRSGDVLVFRDYLDRRFAARPKIVVNAGGPWIDKINTSLGEPTKLIGGTKGSHVLLQHPELVESLKGRMIYFEADDGRICLVYEYLGLALVGSTDTKSDDPDNVKCEENEVDYFLASLKSLLPRLHFDRSQIVYTYSGIRPLPASDAGQPGLISRDHSAPILPPTAERPFSIASLVGGKWTTFRGFAEEVADILLKQLASPRRQSTQMQPIGGGRGFPADAAARKEWIAKRSTADAPKPEIIDSLLARYGTTSDLILSHIQGFESEAPLEHIRGYTQGEIDWIARSEMVIHLPDIVMRRTTMAIEGLLSQAGLEEVAAIAANALGWSEERRRQEVEMTIALLETRHGLSF